MENLVLTKITEIEFASPETNLPLAKLADYIVPEIAEATAAGKTNGGHPDASSTPLKPRRFWVNQEAAEEHIANVRRFAEIVGLEILSATVIDIV